MVFLRNLTLAELRLGEKELREIPAIRVVSVEEGALHVAVLSRICFQINRTIV